MGFKSLVRVGLERIGYEVHRAGSRAAGVVEEPHDEAIWNSVKEYTMTGKLRVMALVQAVRFVVESGVPGDFVECGVWRGGSAMAIAMKLESMGVRDRRIWLYDTFQGMTEPTDADVEAHSGRRASDLLARTIRGDGSNIWCIAGLSDVRRNMELTRYPEENIRFVEGDVLRTLPNTKPEQIALLRLDTDWYESTRVELSELYPRLQVGGICILDDYGYWRGSKQAADEYFAENGPRPLFNRIDCDGRLLVKTHP